jgi:hypothetical protein
VPTPNQKISTFKTLTQAVHELHTIEPQHERSSDKNAKLLAYLTALISADIKNKGKAVFDPGG